MTGVLSQDASHRGRRGASHDMVDLPGRILLRLAGQTLTTTVVPI